MWIHIPKESYPSTQEEEDSTLDLDWLFPLLEQSVMWREKSRQSQSWSTASKKESWMMHLFGQIPQPSMATLGLEKWIGSLGDSPANPGQSQENEKENKTKDGFGMTSSKSVCRYDPKDSSWKMFQASLLDMELMPYLEIFPKWGSMHNGEVLRQPILEPPIDENVYLSWQQEQEQTADSMTSWATPKTFDASSQRKLTDGENVSHSTGTKYGIFLVQQATQSWKTPTTHDFIDHNQMELNEKGRRNPKKGKTDYSVGLGDQVKITNWITPTATNIDTRSEEAMEKRKKFRTSIGRKTTPPGNLAEQVNSASSLQHQTQKNGNQSSENTQDSPQPWKNLRLNPMFVEWLMGWPLDLTGLTDSEYLETELYLYKQRMHLQSLLGD